MKVEIQRKHAVSVERDGFGHLIPRHSLPLHSLGLASRILRETFGPWRPLVAKRQRVAGCFIAALTCYEKPRHLKSSAAILRAAVLHTSQRCASLIAISTTSIPGSLLGLHVSSSPGDSSGSSPAEQGRSHARCQTGRLVFRYLQHALHVERVSLDPL